MRKTMVCKPAPELEIDCGGVSVLLRFDLLAVSALQEMEEGLTGIIKKSLPELAACIIYATGKNNNENFDLQEARKIVSCMSIDNITEIIQMFSDSMGVAQNEAQKELTKNMMAQFLQSLK